MFSVSRGGEKGGTERQVGRQAVCTIHDCFYPHLLCCMLAIFKQTLLHLAFVGGTQKKNRDVFRGLSLVQLEKITKSHTHTRLTRVDDDALCASYALAPEVHTRAGTCSPETLGTCRPTS